MASALVYSARSSLPRLKKSTGRGNSGRLVRGFRRSIRMRSTPTCDLTFSEHADSATMKCDVPPRKTSRARAVQCREHGLPALGPMLLQMPKLKTRKLVERLQARQQLIYTPLSHRIHAPHTSAGAPSGRREDQSRSVALGECMYSRAMRTRYASRLSRVLRSSGHSSGLISTDARRGVFSASR